MRDFSIIKYCKHWLIRCSCTFRLPLQRFTGPGLFWRGVMKDVRRWLRKEHFGPILKKLRDKESSKPSTTVSRIQALYVLYWNLLGSLPNFQADLSWPNNFNTVTKKKADSYITDKEITQTNTGSRILINCFKIRSDARAKRVLLHFCVWEVPGWGKF